MEAITVKDLMSECQRLIREGKGEKKILISSDDECNECHHLYYGFSPISDFGSEYAMLMPYGVTEKNVNEFVLLG